MQTISTSLYPWTDLYTFFIKWFVEGQCSSARSMGPVSQSQWTEEAEGRAKTRPWSILPFICHHPPNLLADQQPEAIGPGRHRGKRFRVRGVLERWRNHSGNRSHRSHGRRITADKAAAQTSFVPCCWLSRLASAISMGSDVTVVIIHPTRPIPICLTILGKGGWGAHSQPGVIIKSRFFSVHYNNKQCEWGRVGGGQRTSHTLLGSVWSCHFKTPQTNTISFAKRTRPWNCRAKWNDDVFPPSVCPRWRSSRCLICYNCFVIVTRSF